MMMNIGLQEHDINGYVVPNGLVEHDVNVRGVPIELNDIYLLPTTAISMCLVLLLHQLARIESAKDDNEQEGPSGRSNREGIGRVVIPFVPCIFPLSKPLSPQFRGETEGGIENRAIAPCCRKHIKRSYRWPISCMGPNLARSRQLPACSAWHDGHHPISWAQRCL